MTANVGIPLNKGDFYETWLPTSWLWFTPLAVQTYNLALSWPRKHINCNIPSRTSFVGTITKKTVEKNSQAEKNSGIETEQCYLCRSQNLMLITPPNDQATAYGTYWKYLAEH